MPIIDLTLLNPALFDPKEVRDTPPAHLLARFIEEVFALCYANRPMSVERVSGMRSLLEKVRQTEWEKSIELNVREFEFVRGMLLDTPLPSGNFRMMEAMYRMFQIGTTDSGSTID